MQNAYLQLVSLRQGRRRDLYTYVIKRRKVNGMLNRNDTLFEASGTCQRSLQDYPTDPINSHHRFGHNGARVLDLFGHVCDRVLPKHHEHA
jgi:hypothetical protein